MINREEFQLHKEIVEWLMANGVPFMSSMSILSYAIKTDRSIAESYFELRGNLIETEDNKKE